jgi:hypothetical protein
VDLKAIVERYRASAPFGESVPLETFGLGREETERVFGILDEDYHISRFFHFSSPRSEASAPAFRINGFDHTHVSIDAEIQSIL